MEQLGPFYREIVKAQAEGDWEKGLRVTLEGVEENDGMSLWWYGYLNERRLWGKTVDPEIAFYFYEKSAEQNCQRGIAAAVPRVRHKNLHKINECGALFILGRISLDNIQTSAMLSDDPFVLYHAKLTDHNGVPTTDSVARLKKSADMGFATGQYSYYLWTLSSRRDSTYLIKAASQRFAQAVESLCSMYLGQAEYVKAHYWHKMSGYKSYGIVIDQLFTNIDNCRASVMTLIAIRKYCCHGSVLSIFPKELVVMFAKALWATWRDDAWGNTAAQQQCSPKRLKQ